MKIELKNGIIELDKLDDDYLVTLVNREVDCSTITKEEFIKYITDDMYKASFLYEEIAKNESVIREEVYRKQEWDYCYLIACKKYKRPAKIEEYAKKLYDKAMASHKLYVGEFTFADFQLTPSISISSGCCLTIDKLLVKADTCYEYVKNDKYFPKVKGWSIVYITRYNEITDGVHSLAYSFRPYFKFIMDEEATKMLNEENRKLIEDVTRFYDGCTYWGD